ncbi:hypothetical protein [Kribbella sp. CA-247076]|uniref:hypothetical protein n=1 Tax=Kribbella sp. CA-247076 TaxID=3239941 RepID=UPI003D8B65FE
MCRNPSPPTTDFTLSAWVDESVIVGGPLHADGCYTLAAAVTDTAAADGMRDVLRDLTLFKAGRLHWVDESAKRRDHIIASVAALDLAAVVTVGSPVHRAKQERARRCCLERLLYELGLMGVTDVCLESRTATPDRRDLRLVDSARDKGLMPKGLKVGFARPRDEPMLWIADAVAGAVTASRLGEPRWLVVMTEILTQHEVDVR